MYRWSVAFDNMRTASSNILERTFLGEIVTALRDDAERIQMELARYAQARGACQLHDKPEVPAPNAPSASWLTSTCSGLIP